MLGNKSNKQHYRVGGTRGGQDQFKWDDVKVDKHRENYLGNSVLAPVGRWQKGRDLTWYNKSGKRSIEDNKELEQSVMEEKRRMKELDEESINLALGIKSSKKRNYEASLDTEEMRQLLSKGDTEELVSGERIKGLGAGPVKLHDHIEKLSHVQKEINRIKSGKEKVESLSLDKIEQIPLMSMNSIPSNKIIVAHPDMTQSNGRNEGNDNGHDDGDHHTIEKKKKNKKEHKKHHKDKKKKDKQ